MATLRTRDDVEIYYEVKGGGPPLLLIGGLGSTTYTWYGQIPFFSRYYKVITFDNEGAGRSSKPCRVYSIEEMAADALYILNHLEIEKAFVMGISMGGMIAQSLAIMAQERVLALVLCCTHCGGKLRISPDPKILDTFTNNKGLTVEEIIDKNLPYLLSREFIEKSPKEVFRYKRVILSQPIQPEHAYLSQLEAIKRFDCSHHLHKLKIPVLIIAGSKDQIVPPENAKLLASLIPNAKVLIFEGAGHALHVECRDQLNREVHQFFTFCLKEGCDESSRFKWKPKKRGQYGKCP